jgi:L-asparaginase / beta-aspartyl-peptidase
MQPVIAIHGGAGDIPDSLVAGHEQGVRRAADIGLEILQRRGSAEDAVEAAIRYLEDDETFDAGRGSFLNQDGEIELDASFMEGHALEAGAIAGVRDIANPISLARLVMNSEQVFYVGEGASRFAEQHGMQRCTRERLLVPRELALWEELKGAVKGDTVGAVALDYRGHLAAGTSTGGRPFKPAGRVGDVPCIGAGLYADDQLGATSSTGEGEFIIRVVMAKWAVDHLAGGRDPQWVTREAIQHLYDRVKGEGGLIMIDRLGRVGCCFNTRRMSRAWSVGTQIIAQVEPLEDAAV